MTISLIHESVLLGPPEAYLQTVGFTVTRSFATHRFGYRGLIDLFATRGDQRLAIEAEMSPDRVLPGDVGKALAVRATHLFIVTPNRRVADACTRRIKGSDINLGDLVVLSRPLGPFMTRLKALFPVSSGLVTGVRTSTPGSKSGNSSGDPA